MISHIKGLLVPIFEYISNGKSNYRMLTTYKDILICTTSTDITLCSKMSMVFLINN